MGTERHFGKMKDFRRWIVVVVQLPLSWTLKNSYNGKFCYMYLPQFLK